MARSRKKLRILIADDHELVRHGIRGILRARHAWSVVGEAVDGREAVLMAQSLRPDLAILDITMPNQDGLEATRQILEAAPNAKVVILTMHESDQMVRRVLEAGARGYVLKSDLATSLVKAIEQVCRGKLFLTPKVSEIVLQGFLKESKRSEEVRPTPREIEIIRLLTEGKANKEIASELAITVRTVEAHRSQLMHKLGMHSLAELIHYAMDNGISPARESR
jgi:DNA-binding NarL/FixJ family response regulator